MDIKNGASATFREVLLRESIPEGAVPPKIDEITILKNGSPSPGPACAGGDIQLPHRCGRPAC
ncbi:hypothetical protein B6U83_05010 [Thermoplasmatales archaeon ex4484_36]|nr:MAG: hypothetical protein B6U83_05010 [Thermoplasmatales archaeon ex4484_36]